MSFERIMGIEVLDEVEYQKYRDKMTLLLHAAGGEFGFDFKVSEVLKSKSDGKINRVFTITFDSEKDMIEFFNSEDYLAVREMHFEKSVGDVTVISLHEKTH